MSDCSMNGVIAVGDYFPLNIVVSWELKHLSPRLYTVLSNLKIQHSLGGGGVGWGGGGGACIAHIWEYPTQGDAFQTPDSCGGGLWGAG